MTLLPAPQPVAAPPIQVRLLGAVEISGASDADLLLRQPKLLSVLAFLLLARPAGFHRRDRLMGLFWPDADDARARAALRTALSQIRAALGADVVMRRGDAEVAVDTSLVWCDAAALRQAIQAGELARALELYRGAPLEGAFGESAAFEQWLDEERQLYRAMAADAAWALAEKYEKGTDLTTAGRWARKAARLAGADERRIRRIMSLLARGGDRAGAIAVYETFVRDLAKELELEPSAETRALAAQIRAGNL